MGSYLNIYLVNKTGFVETINDDVPAGRAPPGVLEQLGDFESFMRHLGQFEKQDELFRYLSELVFDADLDCVKRVEMDEVKDFYVLDTFSAMLPEQLREEFERLDMNAEQSALSPADFDVYLKVLDAFMSFYEKGKLPEGIDMDNEDLVESIQEMFCAISDEQERAYVLGALQKLKKGITDAMKAGFKDFMYVCYR
nr:hypothetical protein [Candidatus Sigynarchaeota archaeon]